MQKLIQGLRLNTKHSLLRCNLALIYQIAGNLNGCGSRSLSVSCLQEVQLALLDGELHILHITVVILQAACNLHKLLEALRKVLLKLGDGLRCTDTCHNVLTLGIDQILAEDTLLARSRISGKCNAGSGGVAHISEHHSLYVDSGSPVAGNVIHTAVYNGTLVVPGTEHGLYSLHKLYLGILGEVLSHLFLINGFVSCNNLFQIVCC